MKLLNQIINDCWYKSLGTPPINSQSQKVESTIVEEKEQELKKTEVIIEKPLKNPTELIRKKIDFYKYNAYEDDEIRKILIDENFDRELIENILCFSSN